MLGQAGRLLSQEDGPAEPALWTPRDRALVQQGWEGEEGASLPHPCCLTTRSHPLLVKDG